MSTVQTTNAIERRHEPEIEPGTSLSTITAFDDRGSNVRTTIDTTTNDGIARMVNALAGSDAQLQQSTDRELIVVDYLVHAREVTDEQTGEVTQQLRLVLITEDGRRISGGSKSVIDSWAWIHRAFGSRKPFPHLGVTLKFNGTPGKKGSYIQIANVRVIETLQPPKKAK